MRVFPISSLMMLLNLVHYRGTGKGKFSSWFLPDFAGICNFSRKILYLSTTGVYIYHIWLSLTIIRLIGDMEENPGPKCNSNQSFSICCWNLNSITAHNYLKISLLRPYISLHNFNVVSISETYLDSTTALDDENLEITQYNLLRVDHASNSKRGGFCVYYKSSLALRLIDVCYLQECIIFKILIGGKSCNFSFFISITKQAFIQTLFCSR